MFSKYLSKFAAKFPGSDTLYYNLAFICLVVGGIALAIGTGLVH